MKHVLPEDKVQIESQVFQKLIAHLQKHPEVQNIDLMNLAYFCRNCMAKWYLSAAKERGIELTYAQAQEIIYSMPIEDYKAEYQEPASEEQIAKYEISKTKASE